MGIKNHPRLKREKERERERERKRESIEEKRSKREGSESLCHHRLWQVVELKATLAMG